MRPLHLLSRRFVLLIILFLLLIIFYHQYVLKKVGYFLVYEQEPQKADVIIVLNGRDTERSLAAVDLYNKGYADLIVMSRGAKQPGSDEFWKRVGSNFNGTIFFQRAVAAMGVPEKSFRFIGNGVASTYDEALATREFLKKIGYKSILLVTSKWHSKRAYLTFRSALKNDAIKIVIQPSKYDSFDPEMWWKNKDDAELVSYEYMRLIYYILSFRISFLEIIH